jgi:hypothetical protein
MVRDGDPDLVQMIREHIAELRATRQAIDLGWARLAPGATLEPMATRRNPTSLRSTRARLPSIAAHRPGSGLARGPRQGQAGRCVRRRLATAGGTADRDHAGRRAAGAGDVYQAGAGLARLGWSAAAESAPGRAARPRWRHALALATRPGLAAVCEHERRYAVNILKGLQGRGFRIQQVL